jgi:Protein of unknown function (DUF2867)
MTATPTKTQAPRDSLIEKLAPACFFHGAWSMPAGGPGLSAPGQFLKAARHTPGWVSACMALRDGLVALFGLKNLGALDGVSRNRAVPDYPPGNRVGIFTLFENTRGEVAGGPGQAPRREAVRAPDARARNRRLAGHADHGRARAQPGGPGLHAAGRANA